MVTVWISSFYNYWWYSELGYKCVHMAAIVVSHPLCFIKGDNTLPDYHLTVSSYISLFDVCSQVISLCDVCSQVICLFDVCSQVISFC